MTERIPLYGEHTEAAAQLARVFEAAGCQTQAELAAVLDVRLSSVSEAAQRGAIPPDWLIKLLSLRGVNPAWITDGIAPRFLTPGDNAPEFQQAANHPHECFPPPRAVDATIVRRILRCFPARDLADELQRRETPTP